MSPSILSSRSGWTTACAQTAAHRSGLMAFAPCCAAPALYEGAAADPCRPLAAGAGLYDSLSRGRPAQGQDADVWHRRAPSFTTPGLVTTAAGLAALGDNSGCGPGAALHHHAAKLSVPGFLRAAAQPAGLFRQRPARAGKKRKRSLAPRAAEELALDVTAAELSSSQQFAAPRPAQPGARAGTGPRGVGRRAPLCWGLRGCLALLCPPPTDSGVACMRSPASALVRSIHRDAAGAMAPQQLCK